MSVPFFHFTSILPYLTYLTLPCLALPHLASPDLPYLSYDPRPLSSDVSHVSLIRDAFGGGSVLTIYWVKLKYFSFSSLSLLLFLFFFLIIKYDYFCVWGRRYSECV